MVFFTTYYLTREQVGEFDLILITINLLIPLVSLQLSDAGLRWLLGEKNDEFEIKRSITSIFVFLVLSILLFTIFYQSYCLFKPSSYSILFNLLLAMQVVYVFFQQTIRGLGFNKLYATNSVINAFVYCGTSILLLTLFELKVEALLISNIFALSLTSVQLFFRAKMYRYISIHSFSFNHLRGLITYSLPLIPNSLSWWAMSSANRYMILLFLGAYANGIFAISYKIPTIMTMLVGVFSLAWQESSILTYDSKDRDMYYTNIFKKYLCVIFSISYLIISVNQIFIKIAVSGEFFESYRYTPILILSTIFNSIAGFYGTGYLGAKKTKHLLISSVIGGITTLLISLVLIPQFGLFGASTSILLGYIILSFLRVSQSKEYFIIDFPHKIFIVYLILYIIISAIGYIENLYANIFNVLFACCIIYVLNKNVIKSAIKTGLNKVINIKN